MLRKMAAAFSMYSKIPMPYFELDDKDCDDIIMFLPLIGVVCAIAVYGVHAVAAAFGLPAAAEAAAVILVPLVITGGFHVDGFLDTADALHSYRAREEKFRILSDPHVGSFAVISLAVAGLSAMCALLIICDEKMSQKADVLPVVCLVFIISRILAGLTSVYLPVARADDMIANERKASGGYVKAVLIAQLAAALAVMAYTDLRMTAVLIPVYAVYTLIYRHVVMKDFGGVLGDTAGYFVTVSEVVGICAAAAGAVLIYG